MLTTFAVHDVDTSPAISSIAIHTITCERPVGVDTCCYGAAVMAFQGAFIDVVAYNTISSVPNVTVAGVTSSNIHAASLCAALVSAIDTFVQVITVCAVSVIATQTFTCK